MKLEYSHLSYCFALLQMIDLVDRVVVKIVKPIFGPPSLLWLTGPKLLEVIAGYISLVVQGLDYYLCL